MSVKKLQIKKRVVCKFQSAATLLSSNGKGVKGYNEGGSTQLPTTSGIMVSADVSAMVVSLQH